MKLIIFITSMECGGAQRVAANLANHWANKGWEICLATIARRERDFYALNPAIRRVAFDLEGRASGYMFYGLVMTVRRIMALRRELKRVRPDTAMAMMHSSNVILAFAALGIPNMITVGTEHIYPPREPLRPTWEWLRKLSYRWLSTVTALTNEGAEWLRVSTHAKSVSVIPNAVIWPLAPQPPIADPQEAVPANRRVLLAAGRFVEQKQYSHLIEAFAALADTRPDWQLVILGDGPLRTTIESLVYERNLRGRVLLPGQVGNIAQWYERSDLYVMTSLFEGFPSTLIEAMSYGLPAVSYDCDTGPRDIIRHEKDGLLVSAGNIHSLIDALSRLMADDALRARMSARAIEIRQRYSIQSITGRWEALFEGSRK